MLGNSRGLETRRRLGAGRVAVVARAVDSRTADVCVRSTEPTFFTAHLPQLELIGENVPVRVVLEVSDALRHEVDLAFIHERH